MERPRSIRPRSTGSAETTTEAVGGFLDAQQRVLDRYGVDAERRSVPTSGGTAQVLVAGEGPPLPMVIGGTVPAVFWAPLMARLRGRTLCAIELPGFGLTDPVRYHHATLRRTAVAFLDGVLDGLGIGRCDVVSQSMGSQWTAWLAADRPARVRSQVMIGCPAFFLDTSAPLPMRLFSVPGLGRALQASSPPSPRGAERIIRMVGEDPEGLAELRDVLVAAQRVPTYGDSTLALMRAVMRSTRPRAEIVLGPDELRRVGHPVRLVWGEQDPFGRLASGRRAAELMPVATFHVVPGGHAPWFHHADLVAGLVRDLLDTV